MDSNKLFIKEFDIPEEGTDSAREMVKVVPSALWIAVLGGTLVVISFVIWAFFGTMTMTANIMGFYHPEARDEGEIICYVPLVNGKKMSVGMNATMYPEGIEQQEYGHMKGTITYVDDYITDASVIYDLIDEKGVANALAGSGGGVLVVIKLEEDADSTNGFYWSNKRGKAYDLKNGTYINISVKTDNLRPIDYMLPDFEE